MKDYTCYQNTNPPKVEVPIKADIEPELNEKSQAVFEFPVVQVDILPKEESQIIIEEVAPQKEVSRKNRPVAVKKSLIRRSTTATKSNATQTMKKVKLTEYYRMHQ